MQGIDILPLVEVKEWLKCDYTDDDLLITELIELAYGVLVDSIDDFNIKIMNDRFKSKFKHCMRCSIADLYDNRTSTTDKTEKLKLINQNALLQLKYSKYE